MAFVVSLFVLYLVDCFPKLFELTVGVGMGKPTDLDLHCLQNRVYPGSAGQWLRVRFRASKTGFKPHSSFCCCCCVEVLRPSQSNGVMSSAVSLPNHTFTGQA